MASALCLRDALASKCLVPVLSGDYFFRPWCFSEWQSFVDRENLLHLDITSDALIVRIIHNDGKHFPHRAHEYQSLDFKDCCTTSGNFQNHAKFPRFEEKIELLAEAVATVVERAPVFEHSWPASEVDFLKIAHSAIDEDYVMDSLGQILTFYSYKGGVGRSMALVNVATLLAKWRQKVLVIDWDLEAPGIESYFKKYLDLSKIAEDSRCSRPCTRPRSWK